MKAAANIAHAQTLANGGAQDDDVDLEGATITMIGFYPIASAAGITSAAQVDTTNDYAATAGGTGVATTITYSLSGGTGTCQVAYTSADHTVDPPTVASVLVDITGC